MPNTLRGWTETLSISHLPAMAPSLERISELLDSPNTTNIDLQQVIDRDPGSALAIFRGLPSRSGVEREPPATLAHAISLLGLPAVGKIMREVTLLLGSKHVAADGLIRCYSRAIHAAYYARHWGQQHGDDNPEEMGLAAMFYSCGEMALWAHAEGRMRKIESLVASGLDHNHASMAILGCSLNQLSLTLAKQWKLPALTSAALNCCWPLQRRTLEVVLAATLARSSEQSWDSTSCLDIAEHMAQLQGLSTDHASASMHNLATGIAREMETLPLPVTATQFVTPYRVPIKPPKSSNRLQQIFSKNLKIIRRDLGMQRTLFAILSSDRKKINARFVLGATRDDPIRQLSIPLDKNSLFAILLSKPQGIWMNAKTRSKYLPLIPEKIQKSIDTRGFFALSLFVNDRPIGILYADATEPDSLTEAQFRKFKQLGQHIANKLAADRGK